MPFPEITHSVVVTFMIVANAYCGSVTEPVVPVPALRNVSVVIAIVQLFADAL